MRRDPVRCPFAAQGGRVRPARAGASESLAASQLPEGAATARENLQAGGPLVVDGSDVAVLAARDDAVRAGRRILVAADQHAAAAGALVARTAAHDVAAAAGGVLAAATHQGVAVRGDVQRAGDHHRARTRHVVLDAADDRAEMRIRRPVVALAADQHHVAIRLAAIRAEDDGTAEIGMVLPTAQDRRVRTGERVLRAGDDAAVARVFVQVADDQVVGPGARVDAFKGVLDDLARDAIVTRSHLPSNPTPMAGSQRKGDCRFHSCGAGGDRASARRSDKRRRRPSGTQELLLSTSLVAQELAASGFAYHSVAGPASRRWPRLTPDIGPRTASPMLHPNQFTVNEAWIAFQLNDAPIRTEQDGTFNCLALMDAASCVILGTEFVAASQEDASQLEIRRLVKKGVSHENRLPKTLLLAREHASASIEREAARQKIAVVHVPERELLVFTGEARDGFRERFGSGG
jgi:hypothetical protein